MIVASSSGHTSEKVSSQPIVDSSAKLDKLFESKNPSDVIQFYEHFEGAEDLIKWMKSRPKSSCMIKEVEGDNDIVVVIPTSDFESDYARRCREEIFHGLRIVFVVGRTDESGYFSNAKNSNTGVRRALAHNPRWIVWSNDDMFRIDSPEVLKRELSRIENDSVDVVFTQPSDYHSLVYQLASSSLVRRSLLSLSRKGREAIARDRKFQVERFAIPGTGLFWRTLYKSSFKFRQTCTLGIFSSDYVRRRDGILYDETYINACEDSDLSIDIAAAETSGELTTATIDYRIGDIVGGSLGVDASRSLRNLAGETYLNQKIRTGRLRTPNNDSR